MYPLCKRGLSGSNYLWTTLPVIKYWFLLLFQTIHFPVVSRVRHQSAPHQSSWICQLSCVYHIKMPQVNFRFLVKQRWRSVFHFSQFWDRWHSKAESTIQPNSTELRVRLQISVAWKESLVGADCWLLPLCERDRRRHYGLSSPRGRAAAPGLLGRFPCLAVLSFVLIEAILGHFLWKTPVGEHAHKMLDFRGQSLELKQRLPDIASNCRNGEEASEMIDSMTYTCEYNENNLIVLVMMPYSTFVLFPWSNVFSHF